MRAASHHAAARWRARVRGFTLMELVVTLALLGVVAMMAQPLAEVAAQRQRERDLREALREIRSAIDRYHLAWEQGLIERKVGASGYPPDLRSLVDGVVNRSSPTGERLIFIRKIPRDPFNPNPNLSAEESWGLRSYASSPDAPSAGADVFDVVTHARGQALSGVPYSQW